MRLLFFRDEVRQVYDQRRFRYYMTLIGGMLADIVARRHWFLRIVLAMMMAMGVSRPSGER